MVFKGFLIRLIVRTIGSRRQNFLGQMCFWVKPEAPPPGSKSDMYFRLGQGWGKVTPHLVTVITITPNWGYLLWAV